MTGRAKMRVNIVLSHYMSLPLTVIVVCECATAAEDRGPRFSNDLGARRDGDGVRHDVDTRVEEDDLATRELQNENDDELNIAKLIWKHDPPD